MRGAYLRKVIDCLEHGIHEISDEQLVESQHEGACPICNNKYSIEEYNSNDFTERENKIISTMAELAGSSLDRIDLSCREMIKINISVLTIFITISKYFIISNSLMWIPIFSLIVGLVAFIYTLQPDKVKVTIGAKSSILKYEELVKDKSKSMTVGYFFSFTGILFYALQIIYSI